MNMLVRGVKAKCQFDISFRISDISNHALSSRRQVLLAWYVPWGFKSSKAFQRKVSWHLCHQKIDSPQNIYVFGPWKKRLLRWKVTFFSFIQLQEPPIHPFTAAALQMFICKRPAPHFDNHERAWKMHFWDPSQWDKMCFECQRIKF